MDRRVPYIKRPETLMRQNVVVICHHKLSAEVSNTDVLERIREQEPRFYREIARQELVYAGHILRGSGGRNPLVILEGKIKGKKAKGKPNRMRFEDIRQWTMLKDYGEVKRSAEDRVAWMAITRQPST